MTMVRTGMTHTDVGKRLGLHPDTIGLWVREAEAAEARMAKNIETMTPEQRATEVSTEAVWDTVVMQSAITQQNILDKLEKVVFQMFDHVLAKVEDADLETLVSAIDRLLNRVESLRYRPQAEDRTNKIVDALVDRATPEQRERVQSAVVETLKRRGVIPIES